MDKQQLAAAAAVMLAASQGAEIQWKYRRYTGANPWLSIPAPYTWNWAAYEYRVKPETIMARMYLDKSDGYTSIQLQREGERLVADNSSFVRWLTDWIEVEV